MGWLFAVIPLVLVGVFARSIWNMNFMDLNGLFARSMTNPPGLSFASNVAGSAVPNVADATVYPLTALWRIRSAQIMAIALFR
jgi:putative transport protein